MRTITMSNFRPPSKPMLLKVEDLTKDFLIELTKTHAIDISRGPDGGTNDENWAKAEEYTTLSILELHIEQCKKGSSLFRVRDFKPAFIKKLKKPQNVISQYLNKKLSITPDIKVNNDFIYKFNKLIEFDELMHTSGLFKEITLSEETQELLKKGKLKPHELLRLNRVLLEDAYPKEIAKNNACPKVSGPCSKYLKLTDISRLKDLKAHVIWNDNGRNENNPHEKQRDDYFNGCDQLIQFCGDLPWKSKKCTFNKVLKKVDRRQKSPNRRKASADRRNYKGPIKKVETIDMRIIRDRRWTTDRRVCDHRGLWAATCLV